MDLNYLRHREQVSILRARAAAGPEARACHRALAKGYAALLANHHCPDCLVSLEAPKRAA